MLMKECHAVENIWGKKRAYASMAFLIDVIPGAVMGAVFAQLSLLAMPLKLGGGGGYEERIQNNTFHEELVLVGPGVGGVRGVDDRVWGVRGVQGERGEDVCVVCNVPPFKAMGEVLVKIAREMGSAKVLR